MVHTTSSTMNTLTISGQNYNPEDDFDFVNSYYLPIHNQEIEVINYLDNQRDTTTPTLIDLSNVQTTDGNSVESNVYIMDYNFTHDDEGFFDPEIIQSMTYKQQESNHLQEDNITHNEKIDYGQDSPPKQRNDGHNFSQNLSSTLVTAVAKNLSSNKAMKEKIKKQMRQFLKNSNGINGQLAQLFVYLYLLKQRAKPQIYQQMLSQITKYLCKRDIQAQRKNEEQKRSLREKINANRELAQILFKNQYDYPLDFNQIEIAGKPLFNHNQKSVLKKIIKKASQIYQKITENANSQE